MLKLYSTGCPECKVLKKKLEESGREFEIVEDWSILNEYADEHGIYEAPFLVIGDSGDEILHFKEALQYLSILN